MTTANGVTRQFDPVAFRAYRAGWRGHSTRRRQRAGWGEDPAHLQGAPHSARAKRPPASRPCTPRSSRRPPRGLPTTSSTTAVATSWRPLPPSVGSPLIRAPPAPCPRCSDASRRRCMSYEMRARRWSRQPVARPASASEPRRATGSWQRLTARGAASSTSGARSTTLRTRLWRRGPWLHDRSVCECRESRLSMAAAGSPKVAPPAPPVETATEQPRNHAGGGTRTPDTRIMIPLRFGSTAGFEGAGGHERGHVCERCGPHSSSSPRSAWRYVHMSSGGQGAIAASTSAELSDRHVPPPASGGDLRSASVRSVAPVVMRGALHLDVERLLAVPAAMRASDPRPACSRDTRCGCRMTGRQP